MPVNLHYSPLFTLPLDNLTIFCCSSGRYSIHCIYPNSNNNLIKCFISLEHNYSGKFSFFLLQISIHESFAHRHFKILLIFIVYFRIILCNVVHLLLLRCLNIPKMSKQPHKLEASHSEVICIFIPIFLN